MPELCCMSPYKTKYCTYRSSHRRYSVKKVFLKISQFHRKTPLLENLFNKFVGLQIYNFIKKRLQHRCFPLKFARFLRTPILKIGCINDTFCSTKTLFLRFCHGILRKFLSLHVLSEDSMCTKNSRLLKRGNY